MMSVIILFRPLSYIEAVVVDKSLDAPFPDVLGAHRYVCRCGHSQVLDMDTPNHRELTACDESNCACDMRR